MSRPTYTASQPPPTSPHLLSLSFNQSASHFTVGTDAGFRIYSIQPLKLLTSPQIGGIHIAEMLCATNYIVLVGGGRFVNEGFGGNKVVVWDEARGCPGMEVEFGGDVKGVRVRKDRLVIALTTKVFIYTFFPTPTKLHVYETIENPTGLLSLSTSTTTPTATLAIPGRSKGQIQILDIPLTSPSPPSSTIIPAHSSTLSCIALSSTGTLIASASDKGTLIRIFDVRSSKLLHELRRGADQARIYSIAFNEQATKVCVASDKGTIHVFNLTGPDDQTPPTTQTITNQPTPTRPIPTTSRRHSNSPTPSLPNSSPSSSPTTSSPLKNRHSILSSLSPYLPKYFSSQWSFAQFHLPIETKTIAAFASLPSSLSPPDPDREAVVVLCADGSLYWFSFDVRKGGEGRREGFQRFFKGLRLIGGGNGQEVAWEDAE